MTRIQRFRACLDDAPWEVLFFAEDWQLFIECVNRWCDEAVSEATGVSTKELDATEQRLGYKLPMMMREWFRLVAHHPYFRHQAFNYLYNLDDMQIRTEGRATLLPFYEDNQRFFWNIAYHECDGKRELVIEDPIGKFYDDHQEIRMESEGNTCPKYRLSCDFNDLAIFIFERHLAGAFRPECLKESAVFGLSGDLPDDALQALIHGMALNCPDVPKQFWPLRSDDFILGERNFIALNDSVLDQANTILSAYNIRFQADDFVLEQTA